MYTINVYVGHFTLCFQKIQSNINTGYEEYSITLLKYKEQNIHRINLAGLGQTRYYESGINSQPKVIIIEDLYMPLEYYLPTAQALEDNYKVVIYDLLSQGESNTILQPTIEQYVQQFKLLLDHLLLNKSQLYIISHGFGCNILTNLLKQFPKNNINKIFMFGPQLNPQQFPVEKRSNNGSFCCKQTLFRINDEYNPLFDQLNKTMKQYFLNDFNKYQQSVQRATFYQYMSLYFDKNSDYQYALPDLIVDNQVQFYIYQDNQFSNQQNDQKDLDFLYDKFKPNEKQHYIILPKKQYSYFTFITNPCFIKKIIDQTVNEEYSE